jgi:DNA-binding FadR family transcriptional regulator
MSISSIPAQIADLILADLIQTGAKPGQLLPAEARLAAKFVVSRSAVREALKQLAGQGYVEVVNGRGTLVRPLDDSQLSAYFTHALALQGVPFHALMEARKPVEVQSARLAAQRRTDEHLVELRGIIRRMQRSISNAEEYVSLDRELHNQIALASGNIVITHFIHSLRGALNEQTLHLLYRRRNRQQLERVHQLHEIIVSEIAAQNAEAAARAMEIHFSEALTFLVERKAVSGR